MGLTGDSSEEMHSMKPLVFTMLAQAPYNGSLVLMDVAYVKNESRWRTG